MPRLAWAIALLGAATTALAKTVTYNFNVSWVTANPDGLFERKVVGINGQWPLPVIEVDKGDRLVVNMYNGLGDKDASIHFHGMFQNGTNEMDGANMVTQCPIPPGSSFTYDFTVNQNGTYWYHCHTDYCYPDGYRQALIVHDSHAPFEFDDEFTITLSDWYHDMLEDLSHGFMSVYNPTGAEPIPDSFLFNDTLNTKIPVQPNSTYLLRLINHGAFVAQYFYIEGHTFEIVEVDGVYTEPAEAEILYIAIAQRYSVLLKTKNTTDANFAIVTVADTQLLDTITPNLQLNNTNWLEYDSHADYPQASINVSQASDLNPFDDITLVPYDRMPLLPEPDYRINVTVYMNNLITGYNYAFLNDITYTPPKVPSVYTALSSGNLSANPAIYGEYTQPMVLRHNDVVEVILNNGDSGSHPFHLHGHNFQLITRAPPYGPHFYDYLNGDPVGYDPNNHTAFPAIPGYYVIRFVADNPGVWLFHCHIDWHMSSGLAMIMVEAPELMPERMSIPEDHYDACRKAGVAYEGNAAGNAEDFLDLSRQNVQPGFIPGGFTARGIVALVFSVVSAVLGIVSIVVYGLADINPKHKHHAAAPAVSEPGAPTNFVIRG
ncbi:iron transport multicopper oxidase FET3 [Phialemonium atrogriseum]|uniref:Iron transport multicopper oxidase FET3 n=1 Tax=Phialemonium atrogriseum TaxID=1093897 RepID=A0AAJ0BPD5_9PEZI|nr:iron transport multicopper oxidase FET3 [Phialemonium atrogriseum]KAK1762020.1 iron transport multicopper oxidase FET3 [Phialemonium atrogriseum]